MTIGVDADLQVGDIAREAEVNIQTVRYYERRGLVLPHGRSNGGYRLYTTDAVRVVRFIKRAQALGFSLDEVAELLELRRDARGSARNVRASASVKVADINARLQGLVSMRNAREVHLLLRQGLLPVQLRLPRHGRLVLRQMHRLLRVQRVALG